MEHRTKISAARWCFASLGLIAAFAAVALSLLAGSAEADLNLIRVEHEQGARQAVAKPERRPEPRPASPQAQSKAKALPAARNRAGEELQVSDGACERNLAIAGKRGLRLPDGWKINCVGPALDWNGGSHWGVTCPYSECPEGAGPYVSISNPNLYVVSHELCHANFGNDELMADRCAAEHGASLATSPYQ